MQIRSCRLGHRITAPFLTISAAHDAEHVFKRCQAVSGFERHSVPDFLREPVRRAFLAAAAALAGR
jgi:hypothetical protein